MKLILLVLFSLFIFSSTYAQFTATEVGTLPERVSNNAVCEGFIDGVPYLFSFAGIDSTKIYSGIHLKSYRYNIETGESERIADLPDDLGKIGVAASRIGNIIYIAGGYNVFTNNTENTTNKMHRYDIENDIYLDDASDIPVPTDDHVQVVWRDSLIYLITGWNDIGNIPNVQIYNPTSDEWSEGTPVPNLNTYTSFGSSGVIVDDKIYYFGGARSTGNFGIQNNLRIGIINPDQPTEIDWSIMIPDSQINGYRMAATSVGEELHWIGGSKNTYNFNGIAYNGTGAVAPSKRDLYMTTSELEWMEKSPIEVPMDLRGIANISDTVKYIAGGMIDDLEVTNKVYKLVWQETTSIDSEIDISSITVGPNPFQNYLSIQSEVVDNTIDQVDCFDIDGNLVFTKYPKSQSMQVDTDHLPTGIYMFHITLGREILIKKVIKAKN